MENFVVSARKYRPATFDTVVGQQSITRTLKNAIRTEHLAQAFLFCGPRGVGKTTCARILAKTINCFNRTETIEACDACDSCLSFNEGHSLNIYELDAASNNSVDDIRNLIDQVRFAPQIGSHKVYIIDEVHMLSTQAFNAFLKTLEEPPPHAIFILATTEKHKIIPTILSRCQIFDFNRIGIDDIAHHLADIAQKENIQADPDALHIIAQKADGALRDALSIFDQIVSFSGSHISYQSVIDNLNILDYDYYFRISNHLLQHEIPAALLLFNDILSNGFDGHHFINGLAAHFRNLLVCKDPSTVVLLEVGAGIKEKYKQQAANSSVNFLLEALKLTAQCDVQYKGSNNQRLLVELCLMQMASLNSQAGTTEKKKPQIVGSPKTAKTSQNPPAEKAVAVEPPKAEAPPLPPPVHTKDIAPPQEEMAPSAKSVPSEKKETEQKPAVEANPKTSVAEQLKQKKLGTSSISIKSFTEAKKETASENTDNKAEAFQSQDRHEFSEDEFKAAWQGLSEYVQKSGWEGSSMLFSALNTHAPKAGEGFKIHLEVDNRSQLEEMKHRRAELHEYLRKRLKNGAVELQIEVLKDEKKRKAYTAAEKFQKLAEEHPSLNDLKQKLDLDFF